MSTCEENVETLENTGGRIADFSGHELQHYVCLQVEVYARETRDKLL